MKPFRHAALAAAALTTTGLVLAGCTSNTGSGAEPPADATPTADVSAASDGPTEAPVPAPTIDSNIRPNANGVPVDTVLQVSATDGTLTKVKVIGEGEKDVPLKGSISDDGGTWKATDLLEPGSTYVVRTTAKGEDGQTTQQKRFFHTVNLDLDHQTYPNIAPLQGETVGVGMPVVINFDVPVHNRKSIEKHLSVTASKPMKGSWHWYSDTEVHFRPVHYWKPGTKVTVHADVNGVNAGNGIYGQLDRTVSFQIGDSVISKVHLQQHYMDVFINGHKARRIPVTAGKEGFQTRGGIKVVLAKFRTKHMDAATVGIQPGDPDYYNIADVPYALRVTWSGEFVHGAPWSVGQQGAANVSHGCVGMSISDAQWLYERSKRGDIVRVFGSSRPLETDNGYTDWNVPFKTYAKGSALH